MQSSVLRAVGIILVLLLAGTASAAGAAAASRGPAVAAHPQQRRLATSKLSNFAVVLTATRSPGGGAAPAATVSAAGYEHTASGWQLIGTKVIGKANQWSWHATQVCSLAITQFKPEPSAAKAWDAIKVSLLWGPAIGCLGPFTEHWRP